MPATLTLAAALLLDALVGDPRWLWSRLPHPVVAMGRLIGAAERRFNQGTAGKRRLLGMAMILALCLVAAALGHLVTLAPGGGIAELLIAAILIAQRSLADHVAAVSRALRRGVGQGRAAVAEIVGRDTAGMNGPAITRAAIESAAENLSDGVIAPALWFLIAGLPGMLVYKIVNTADSMIGYRTARYEAFGWSAARLDDLLNWIPARLTAVLIWLTHGGRGAWRDLIRDARRHRSPNAGWPEAAMAAAIDVALSGPRSYDGAMQDFPFVHPHGNRSPGPEEIDAAVRALWRTWAAALALVVVISVV